MMLPLLAQARSGPLRSLIPGSILAAMADGSPAVSPNSEVTFADFCSIPMFNHPCSAFIKTGVPMDMSNSTLKPSSARLQQLSDEVSRIATTLARLAVEPEADAKSRREQPANDGANAEVSVETVRKVIRARRLRHQFFDDELFADPAWDMLLDLFEAELAQLRVSVSSLCVAAAVPATTALRWIATMTDAGLFKRRADPADGRRVFVELAPETSEAMRRYFSQLEKPQSV